MVHDLSLSPEADLRSSNSFGLGNCPRVVAIVVAYHPDRELFLTVLSAAMAQSSFCFVVNNGPTGSLPTDSFESDRLRILEMGRNQGIAAAFNRGIAAARSAGASHVLLLDQDSVPYPDMVERLMAALVSHPDAAAVGPRYLNLHQENPPPFVRLEGVRLRRCACLTTDSVVQVAYLISSGCLIPTPVLDMVGGMREDLFIDYVDTEWGLRARHRGFNCYGVCAARMTHQLGDHLFDFAGRGVPMHSAERHYYLFRNAMLLYREPWIPLGWKWADGWRLLRKYFFFAMFAFPRWDHVSMMSKGVLAGLQGNVGKLERRSADAPKS